MIRSLLLFAFGVLFSIGMQAQQGYKAVEDISKFRELMIETSANTSSIQSDFVQMKHLSFLEEDVMSKGKFYFQKENQLRWEYTEPFFYLIIFNQDTIMIQDEHKTNMYDAASGRMFREINNIMLSMVNGTILESDNFEFAYFENNNTYKLELTPLDENMKDFLSTIILFINKDDYSVDELYMIEKSEDYTQIRFINKSMNETIPQDIFNLH